MHIKIGDKLLYSNLRLNLKILAGLVFLHKCSVTSVIPDSLWPHGTTRVLSPWDFPSKNTAVVCHALFQEVFLIQGLNPCLLHLLHCRQILYMLSHSGKPPPPRFYSGFKIVFCVFIEVLWYLSKFCHWVGKAEEKHKLWDLSINEEFPLDSREV